MAHAVRNSLGAFLVGLFPMGITAWQMSLDAEKDMAASSHLVELQKVAYESLGMAAAAERRRADEAVSMQIDLTQRLDRLREQLTAARERCGG